MSTKLTVFVSAVFMTVVLAVYGQPGGQQTAVAAPEGAAAQRAVLDKYCIRCHNQRAKNGITLDSLDLAHVGEKAEQWEKAVRKLRGGMMPPSGEARPDAATLEALTSWLENELDQNSVRQLPPPGLHRLNRTEYTNVVRDLLALEVDATKFLPPDDSTRGFDNMAAALNLSPALVEAYLSAAGKISRLAVGDVKNPTQTVYRVPGDNTQNYHVEGLPFGTRGGIVIQSSARSWGRGERKREITWHHRADVGGRSVPSCCNPGPDRTRRRHCGAFQRCFQRSDRLPCSDGG